MHTNYRPECVDGSHGTPCFLEEIQDFLEPKGRILDLGSYVGYIARYIESKGIGVISINVDISHQ